MVSLQVLHGQNGWQDSTSFSPSPWDVDGGLHLQMQRRGALAVAEAASPGRSILMCMALCPHSAPLPVAWVLSGGPYIAALAGMRTVPLLDGPSLLATATCGPVLPGTRATGVRYVRGKPGHSPRCRMEPLHPRTRVQEQPGRSATYLSVQIVSLLMYLEPLQLSPCSCGDSFYSQPLWISLLCLLLHLPRAVAAPGLLPVAQSRLFPASPWSFVSCLYGDGVRYLPSHILTSYKCCNHTHVLGSLGYV